MRVLYLSQYFPPEVGATQARAHDLAAGLVRGGAEVSVVCEFPNHPGGRIPARYRGKLVERDTLDGIEVVRVWVKASPVKTFASRMAFYISYAVAAVVAGLWTVKGRYDVVYATSPPLFVGAAGVVLSILRRTPFVFEVRDLWPEVAVRMGELRSRHAIALARWLERSCYRRARRVVTVTEGSRRCLVEQGVAPEKIALVANGANTAIFKPRPDAAAKLRRELGLEDAFVALYAGLHGIAQDLGSLLDAAARLREIPTLRVLLIGEGPVKPGLVRRARTENLRNVLFLDEVPRERVAAFFSMADVAVVPLREAALFQGVRPLKVLEAWACGCPVLVAGHGEIAELIEVAGGGACIAPERPDQLAASLRDLSRDPAACREMGARGRRYVTAHLDRAAQVEKLQAVLRSVVDEQARATRTKT